MPKKILIITDDAGESFEILYAQYRFREAGYQPVVAATKKKTINSVIHDMAPGWTTYIEKPGYLIDADTTLTQVRATDYVALLLIGGRAPEFLRHQPKVIKLVQEFHRRGKWLFAICHGIQVLITAGVVEGRKVTSYENVRCEVTACGGTWINRQSVVDGNLVTAQNWGSHAEFYRDIFKQLPYSNNG